MFNGVTGVNAGANMSGDLARPGHSIAVGTVSAILMALSMYFYAAIIMASSVSREYCCCKSVEPTGGI